MGIRSEIRALSHELVSLRRDFHAHPELGFCEKRTAKIVEDYLLSLGLEITRCADLSYRVRAVVLVKPH